MPLTLLIPALGRQRQADYCDFKASLVYKRLYRTMKGRGQSIINQANST